MRNFLYVCAAVIMGTIVACMTMGCTDIGPVDEHYRHYRPWNEDPYAIGPDAPILDRKLMGSAEAIRQADYNAEHPAENIGEYLFRN